MRRALLLLLTPVVLACAGIGGLFESDQMRRARDFIAAEEFESARQELRVHLHTHADDQHAKALLLFIQIAETDADDLSGPAQCLLLGAVPEAASSTAAEEALRETRLSVRKTQLDRGIPTRDWAEYVAVLKEAVAYGWTKHAYPADNTEPRLSFAFCAALQGDQAGVKYLVDHLAPESARERAQHLLYLLGDAAAPALSATAANPEDLAGKHAAATLRNLRLAGVVARFSFDHRDRVSPQSVRTDGTEGRGSSAGRFLMKLGWRDDNEAMASTIDAALTRASLARALTGKGWDDEAEDPIMLRLAQVGDTWVAVLTAALTSSQSTEGVEGDALQPAGINTTFLSEAWRWDGSDWKALPIGGKPSISGPDLALLAVNGPSQDALLSPDQVALLVYRGTAVKKEWVNNGWYGASMRTSRRARVDRSVYHLGATALELIKTTNPSGAEIDEAGVEIEEPK